MQISGNKVVEISGNKVVEISGKSGGNIWE